MTDADHAAHTEARRLAKRVVGKAVHPQALDRLFEIWPEALVRVNYSTTRHDGVDLRVTNVVVAPNAEVEEGGIARSAYCHEDDQFEKATGIALAFRRCLYEISNRDKARRGLPYGNGSRP